MSATDVVQLLISGLCIGGIYALMALGFHIIYAATKILNFAHGVVVMLGGLLALTFLVSLKLNFFLVLVLILLAGCLYGILFNRIVVEQIKQLSHGVQIICLIAVSTVAENIIALIWGKEPLPFPPFPGSAHPLVYKKVIIMPQTLWIIGLTAVGLVVTQLILRRALIGKAIRASANNLIAARLVGINPRRTYAVAFQMAMALGILAGMVISPITFAGGYIAIPMTIKGFTAAVVGGMAGSTACILGGFFLGIVESLTAGLVTTAYLDAVLMSLLLLILLIRPQGLFASRRD